MGKVTDYIEGKIYTHKISLPNGSAETIILIKHKRKFYALSSTCSYDLMTDLSQGVVFGDKIMAPRNGTAYNIKNGEVEWGPSFDNIPIYQTSIENGEISIFVPKTPPKKIRPNLYLRDYSDLRKVVIIGAGPAAVACAETLRIMEYTVKKSA